MTDTDQTAFQRLISDEAQAREMLNDLHNLEGLLDEGQSFDDVDGWEIAMKFTEEDVPYLIDELEDIVDEQQ
jgi:hypothetical protein